MYPNIFNYYKLHALTVATLCPGPANILAQVCSTITRQPIRARNLFKLSTDSARLVVEIKKKKKFCFGFGVLWGRRRKCGVCLRFFGLLYAALDANPMSQFFRSRFCAKLDYHPSL